MNNMLQAALWYQKNGFSVIPAKKDKKPFIKWQSYQETPANEVQIREWWAKWPNANVAIVTGKKSNLTVIDADSEAGRDAVSEFLPDSALIPTEKTPKGWHYYFKHIPGSGNGVRFLDDCDVRSEGGYVIAPPSHNGSKKGYTWLEGLKISDIDLAPMPEMLAMVLEQASFNAVSNSSINSLNTSSIRPNRIATKATDSNNSNIGSNSPAEIIPCSRRDDLFFHLANYLVRGGMPNDNIRFFLQLFLNHCTEQSEQDPFTERDIEAKIESALNRENQRGNATTQAIKDYVSATNGNFSATNLYFEQQLQHPKEKAKARAVLSRLAADGVIERVGSKDGWYRKIDTALNVMDIFKVNSDYLDIKYPLDLHELFRTMPKNIIVVAGTQNVGKTAFLLNLASLNMNRGINVRYITSEMGEQELSNRCKMFEPEIPFSFWKGVQFCDHNFGFSDKVDPDGLNIIDYLEIAKDFSEIADRMKEIYQKLEKGVAVIGIQKKYGAEFGRGAEFSLEKPRLYVTLEANPPEGNIAKIVKCKNWARDDRNPNHLECVFNVIKGAQIRQAISWAKPSKHLKGK